MTLRRGQRSELRDALMACRSALIVICVFSGVINMLMLTGSFFMLEVYDRVLPSRSIPTLLALAAIAVVLYAFLGILDVIRSRVLVRVGGHLNERLGPRVYDTIVRSPFKLPGRRDNLQTLRDLVTMAESDVMKLKNLGKTSLTEIKTRLAEKGLSLGMAANV